MEVFNMYMGHFGIWFFVNTMLIINRRIKLNGNNFMLVVLVFSLLFAIPSCSIQHAFFR